MKICEIRVAPSLSKDFSDCLKDLAKSSVLPVEQAVGYTEMLVGAGNGQQHLPPARIILLVQTFGCELEQVDLYS